ncbi:hypothetical protein WR25_03173 isoform B [Diploscapter pachys]|nr:hypothetical protein WR25_03173 isoform B [Diploscapter pachys]
MSETPLSDSSNPAVQTMDDQRAIVSIPEFIDELNSNLKLLIHGLWLIPNITFKQKIEAIDELSVLFPDETRTEYRKWRFRYDKSSAKEFIESQQPALQIIINRCLDNEATLDDFFNSMIVLRSSFQDKKAFYNWIRVECLTKSKAVASENLQPHIKSFESREDDAVFYDADIKSICVFDTSEGIFLKAGYFSFDPKYNHVAVGRTKVFAVQVGSKKFESFNLISGKIEILNPVPISVTENSKLLAIGDKNVILADNGKLYIFTGAGTWQISPIDFKYNFMCAPIVNNDDLFFIVESAEGLSNDKILQSPFKNASTGSQKFIKFCHLSDDKKSWEEVAFIDYLSSNRNCNGLIGHNVSSNFWSYDTINPRSYSGNSNNPYWCTASVNGRIYIARQNYQSHANEIKFAGICFDPNELPNGKVSLMAPTNYQRICHKFVETDNKIYAIGG